jgi:hypothetical protein
MRKYKIPLYIQSMISEENMDRITDEDECAKLFIQLIYIKQVRAKTVNYHFRQLRSMLFPTTTIIPNLLAFDNRKNVQYRFPQIETLKRYVKYMQNKRASDDDDSVANFVGLLHRAENCRSGSHDKL